MRMDLCAAVLGMDGDKCQNETHYVMELTVSNNNCSYISTENKILFISPSDWHINR